MGRVPTNSDYPSNVPANQVSPSGVLGGSHGCWARATAVARVG